MASVEDVAGLLQAAQEDLQGPTGTGGARGGIAAVVRNAHALPEAVEEVRGNLSMLMGQAQHVKARVHGRLGMVLGAQAAQPYLEGAQSKLLEAADGSTNEHLHAAVGAVTLVRASMYTTVESTAGVVGKVNALYGVLAEAGRLVRELAEAAGQTVAAADELAAAENAAIKEMHAARETFPAA